MKSKPFRSPWGMNKTRMELWHRRDEKFLKPRMFTRSCMSNRMFDNRLSRFDENWK